MPTSLCQTYGSFLFYKCSVQSFIYMPVLHNDKQCIYVSLNMSQWGEKKGHFSFNYTSYCREDSVQVESEREESFEDRCGGMGATPGLICNTFLFPFFITHSGRTSGAKDTITPISKMKLFPGLRNDFQGQGRPTSNRREAGIMSWTTDYT